MGGGGPFEPALQWNGRARPKAVCYRISAGILGYVLDHRLWLYGCFERLDLWHFATIRTKDGPRRTAGRARKAVSASSRFFARVGMYRCLRQQIQHLLSGGVAERDLFPRDERWDDPSYLASFGAAFQRAAVGEAMVVDRCGHRRDPLHWDR